MCRYRHGTSPAPTERKGSVHETSYRAAYARSGGVTSGPLKPEFFAEVNDGTVTLTFHFWSGTQITYRITKSGSPVTGTT